MHVFRACQKVFSSPEVMIHLYGLYEISDLNRCSLLPRDTKCVISRSKLFYHYYLHMKYNNVLVIMYVYRIKTII